MMKQNCFTGLMFLAMVAMGTSLAAQTVANSYNKTLPATIERSASKKTSGMKYYMDVHDLGPGSVTYEDVEAVHEKDLEVQDDYDTKFVKYWVDEARGKVYCLSTAPNEDAVIETHRHAHGLLPESVMEMQPGLEADMIDGSNLFLDIHYLGKGNVTAEAVEAAHQKDLEVQGDNLVNFINYWVDEEDGVVMCLSQAPDKASVIKTHEEAHGLIPDEIVNVKEGQ